MKRFVLWGLLGLAALGAVRATGAWTGVDLPVLLNSTPAETMAHRRERNRDGKVDSPFTTMVLEIEQGLLASQAHKAAMILSKSGELLSYADYQALMANA